MKALMMMFALSTVGCTHMRSLSVTTIPQDRGQPVEAVAEKVVFFGFNASNEYVDVLVDRLAEQCPKGKVSGLLTRTEQSLVFPLVAYRVSVRAQGFCVAESAGAE
jgi:hypothetical protein